MKKKWGWFGAALIVLALLVTLVAPVGGIFGGSSETGAATLDGGLMVAMEEGTTISMVSSDSTVIQAGALGVLPEMDGAIMNVAGYGVLSSEFVVRPSQTVGPGSMVTLTEATFTGTATITKWLYFALIVFLVTVAAVALPVIGGALSRKRLTQLKFPQMV